MKCPFTFELDNKCHCRYYQCVVKKKDIQIIKFLENPLLLPAHNQNEKEIFVKLKQTE